MPTAADPPESSLLSANFYRSVPLFVLAGGFFVAGAVVLLLDPHYGPGYFTLWALLITLGFVSSIGGIASWLLVGEPGSTRPAPRTPSRAARSRPMLPRPKVGESEARPDPTDFGRPAPLVRSHNEPPPYRPSPSDFEPAAADAPDWDEVGAVEESPYPVGDPADLVSVEDALQDLDGIERDLAPRTPRPTSPSSE